MTDEFSIRFVLLHHHHLSTRYLSAFEIFVSRRVSLNLLLTGIWCVPTVQCYSFISSFQPQWPRPPLLLNKLSGNWKISSPVVSVLTPTLNLNCCSVSMCFANIVWSDLWYVSARGYPFIAPPAVVPPSSHQLEFQAFKPHFISTISLRSKTP